MGRSRQSRAGEDGQGSEWEAGLAGQGGPDLQAVDSGLDPGLPSPDVTSFCLVASGSERTLPILGKARRGFGFDSLLPTVCLQLAGQAEPCSTLSGWGLGGGVLQR